MGGGIMGGGGNGWGIWISLLDAGDFFHMYVNVNMYQIKEGGGYGDYVYELILADIFQQGDTFYASSRYFSKVDERGMTK